MELKFIGTGSCFNFERGNNSAYIKWGEKNESMLLIDCGCDVCEKIIRNNLLDGVHNFYIAITHLHDDHSGSLGQLIDYCYHVKNIIVNIIYPSENTIKTMLSTKMISINKYKFYGCYSYTNKGTSWFELGKNGLVMSIVPVSHVDGYDSFSILLSDGKTTIVYTGDINNINLNNINNNFNELGNNFKLYTECTFTPEFSNVHVYYKTLFGIAKECKKNVTVMHLDDNPEKIQELREAGFNIAESELRAQQFDLNSYKSNIIKDENIEVELPIVQRNLSKEELKELFNNSTLAQKEYRINIPEIKYSKCSNMIIRDSGSYDGKIVSISGTTAKCIFSKKVIEDKNIDINKCAISFMNISYLMINKTLMGIKDAILVTDVDRFIGKYDELKKELKDPKDHDIQVSTGTIKDIITHPEKYEDMFKED